MKSCERYSELLSDYAERTLMSEEKKELEAHLQQCPDCHSAAHRIANLRRTLHQLPTVHATPDFETILRARIKLDRRTSSVPLWRVSSGALTRLTAYSFAAIFLIAVAFIYLGQRQTKLSVPSSSPTITVSQSPKASNNTLSSFSTTQFLFTLDKITPQRLFDLSPPANASPQPIDSVSPDSSSTNPSSRPATTPVTYQPISF
jgi:hypothetical protein